MPCAFTFTCPCLLLFDWELIKLIRQALDGSHYALFLIDGQILFLHNWDSLGKLLLVHNWEFKLSLFDRKSLGLFHRQNLSLFHSEMFGCHLHSLLLFDWQFELFDWQSLFLLSSKELG